MCGGGELLPSKSGLKKKNCRFSHVTFWTALKFFTRVEGGIGGPNTPAGALRSPVKTSPNLLAEKIKLQYSCLFYDYFCMTCTAVAHFNNFRNGAERLNNFKRRKIRRFQPVSVAAGTLSGLCVLKNWLAQRRVDTPSKVASRLPIGKTFSREANGTRGAFMPR